MILTLTLSAGEAQRFATALGAEWGLGRDATAAEAKQFVIADIQNLVQRQELAAQQRAAAQAAAAITPPVIT